MSTQRGPHRKLLPLAQRLKLGARLAEMQASAFALQVRSGNMARRQRPGGGWTSYSEKRLCDERLLCYGLETSERSWVKGSACLHADTETVRDWSFRFSILQYFHMLGRGFCGDGNGHDSLCSRSRERDGQQPGKNLEYAVFTCKRRSFCRSSIRGCRQLTYNPILGRFRDQQPLYSFIPVEPLSSPHRHLYRWSVLHARVNPAEAL